MVTAVGKRMANNSFLILHMLEIIKKATYWNSWKGPLYSTSNFSGVVGLRRFYKSHYYKLVGFGRACAPVRCAHPSFLAHCHA
jgi:hypothetical protein